MAHDGMSREEYEEYQKQVVEEKMERDAEFAGRKAERACLRTCLRDKYRLPKIFKVLATILANILLKTSFVFRKIKIVKLIHDGIKSEQDEIMLQQAGDDVDIPEELIKMIDGEAPQEEEKGSIMDQMQNLQNMDMEQLKEKAQATIVEIKSKAEEKCTIM